MGWLFSISTYLIKATSGLQTNKHNLQTTGSIINNTRYLS